MLLLDHSDWEKVDAEVTDSYIRSGANNSITPNISYRYDVNERMYIGSRINFGIWSSSQEETRALVENNQAGKKIEIYYDPNNPSESTMNLEGSILGGFLLLFLTWGTGIFFGLALFRRIKS